jgi:hypothetical protein
MRCGVYVSLFFSLCNEKDDRLYKGMFLAEEKLLDFVLYCLDQRDGYGDMCYGWGEMSDRKV